MFALSFIFGGLVLWSVNHTSISENSELNVFKSIRDFGGIFNDWLNDYLEQLYTELLNLADNHC